MYISQETRQYHTRTCRQEVFYRLPFSTPPFSRTEKPLWHGSTASLHRQVTGHQSLNARPTADGGMRAMLCTEQHVLYFDCQLDPVPPTEHLRGTHKSEQKEKKISWGMRPQYLDSAHQNASIYLLSLSFNSTICRSTPGGDRRRAPIFSSTIIMPWPTCTCTESLMGACSSLFAVNGLQNKTSPVREVPLGSMPLSQ